MSNTFHRYKSKKEGQAMMDRYGDMYHRAFHKLGSRWIIAGYDKGEWHALGDHGWVYDLSDADVANIPTLKVPGDEYVTIYFDLTMIEDSDESEYIRLLEENGEEATADAIYDLRLEEAIEFQRLGYKHAEKTFKRFGYIDNEGNSDYGLSCKFSCKRSKLAELKDFIEREHGGGDDMIFLDGNMIAENFNITVRPGKDCGIAFADWEEFLEQEGLSNE